MTRTGYDGEYQTARRRGSAHLLAMSDGAHTGLTLCGRDASPFSIARDGEPVCRACNRAADAIDAGLSE